LSGVTELPFAAFLAMMLPIHLAIGLIEGLVTAGVIVFVLKAQPEILARTATGRSLSGIAMKPVLIGLTVAALFSGTAFAWFASASPDGLEWSIAAVAGTDEIEGASATLHESLAGFQEQLSFLPDYGFRASGGEEAEGGEAWPAVDVGTSTAGVVGAAITLAFSVAIGLVLRRRAAARRPSV
jgi:cobalt/nickel transport system permease protein